jgi:hypothetical protein
MTLAGALGMLAAFLALPEEINVARCAEAVHTPG